MRVAAAGPDVALRAVGVQVGARPAIQILFRVVRVHEPRVFVRSEREERRNPRLALAAIVRRLPDVILHLRFRHPAGSSLRAQVILYLLPPVQAQHSQVLQHPELIVPDLPVNALAVHLERGQAEDEVGGATVARHALRPAGVVPRLLADTTRAPRGSRYANDELAVGA